MNKHSYILEPETRDGTSQRGRALPALDPDYVSIDERSTADLLAFVRQFAAKLRFLEADEATGEVVDVGNWTNFVQLLDEDGKDVVSISDIIAYIADPSRIADDKAHWLARPHFALLLTFLELLGYARDQLNDLTQRHLDYYYREVLHMLPEPAVADRAAVVFRLAPRVTQAHLPAGTALRAGRDANGVARTYETERDVFISRAQVAELRSVFVRRDITSLADVWTTKDSGNLTDTQVFEQMLSIALGHPKPGDPLPYFEGAIVDIQFVDSLLEHVRFCKQELRIDHHELRALIRLGARLSDTPTDDDEWPGLVAWIEEIGKRRQGSAWVFPSPPTTFVGALAAAFSLVDWQGLPFNSATSYHAYIYSLELFFAMPAERLERLARAADLLTQAVELDDAEWAKLEDILTQAHVEKHRIARRRDLFDDVWEGRNNLEGFDALVSYVLGESVKQNDLYVAPESFDWGLAQKQIAGYLQPGQLDMLEDFHARLVANEGDPQATNPLYYEWWDMCGVLVDVQLGIEGLPDPVPELIAWHNLYAYADATTVVDLAEVPRWKTFGRAPASEELAPPQASLGWGLRSPMLALSEGTRTLTLMLAFVPESFDITALVAALEVPPIPMSEDPNYQGLAEALSDELAFEVTTAKGWMPVEVTAAELNSLQNYGAPNTLTLTFTIDAAEPALEPITKSSDRWPTLRALLRRADDGSTKYWAFEALQLLQVRLLVEVAGLTNLQIQYEDRALDPHKPFELFGNRPVVGSRMYLNHPELARARLNALTLAIEWMGMPSDLAGYYNNYHAAYPDFDPANACAAVSLIEDKQVQPISLGDPLFVVSAGNVWQTSRILYFSPVSNNQAYDRRLDIEPVDDVRNASRHLRLELVNGDLGHALYPTAAAKQATLLAAQLALDASEVVNNDYQVNPPYTPTIKQLSVSYQTWLDIDPSAPSGEDVLFHIHPFGVSPLDADEQTFLPRYDNAGELYIGLRDVDFPQNLSLLLQLAEGTSNPDIEASPVKWAYLDGNHWRSCDVVFDSTRGLINSGIVELKLRAVAPSTRLPGDKYWLRAAIARNTDSVCETVAIRTQAVTARFVDRGNAPSHYEQPLPVGSITRLLEPDARIAAIEQPFTSFGGKPPERDEVVNTRVSERLRHKQRAVTPWDYERLVLGRFGQIYKVKCLPAGTSGYVDVVVVPDIRNALPGDPFAPKAPANLLADIHAYLVERTPATATVRVRNARYVPVLLRIAVRFQSGLDEGYFKKQLNEDLNRFLSPWAYDQGADLEIGGKIYANSIIDFVDRLDYVDYVANLLLFTYENGVSQPGTIGSAGEYYIAASQPDTILVAARQHHIEVVLENGYQAESFTGIGYMKIELDFIIA